MARTFVVKQPDGDRAPFLRGILVQSLVQSGLSFDDAYATAQSVREQLRDIDEISSKELHRMTAEVIKERFDAEVCRAYDAQPDEEQEIVIYTRARKAPFSVGILARSLEACAIPSETAWGGARHVQEYLQQSGHQEIGHKALRRVIYECLLKECSITAAQRYLSWRQFENSGVPLILLLGGATGTGKSTITAEIAYRLDVVRTQSTDMMRQIIRCYLAPHVVPTLGYSSFEAWRGLPAVQDRSKGHRVTDNPVIAGFLAQFSAVRVALEATITRAIEERQHLVIDGIHVVPTELDLRDIQEKAIVVPVKLATMRKRQLEMQLARRGREQPARKPSRYLEHLDDIWELQSYLLSEADKAGIPIIPNWTIEQTVREILDLVSTKVIARFPPDLSAID